MKNADKTTEKNKSCFSYRKRTIDQEIKFDFGVVNLCLRPLLTEEIEVYENGVLSLKDDSDLLPIMMKKQEITGRMQGIRLRAVEMEKNRLLEEGKTDAEIVDALDRFIMPQKILSRVHKMEEELDNLFNSETFIKMQKESERIAPLNRANDKKLVELALTNHSYYGGGITFPEGTPEEFKSFNFIWDMMNRTDRTEILGLTKELCHLNNDEVESVK